MRVIYWNRSSWFDTTNSISFDPQAHAPSGRDISVASITPEQAALYADREAEGFLICADDSAYEAAGFAVTASGISVDGGAHKETE